MDKTTNGNQPAFPDTGRAAESGIMNQAPWELPTGLTKREYFAAMAMQGLISTLGQMEVDVCMGEPLEVRAVQFADGLLEALNKNSQGNG